MSLRKMNLVMTYPVNWSEHGILSNFVQNFFDAIGPDHFAKDFFWTFQDDGKLIMKSETGFAREWLYFIGTSTKRSNHVSAAGCFGEGFKIASLVGMRDFGLDIVMESRDWRLHVTTAPGTIANTPTSFLAYDISPRPYQDNSLLVLSHAGQKMADTMQKVMTDFYYRGNPLFGKCLASANEYAIYESAPASPKEKTTGYLFARFQKRAFLHVPLIICNHFFTSDSDDRDRYDFDDQVQEQCICEVMRQLDAAQSLEILQHIRPVWCSAFRKHYYGYANWEKILPVLIRNIRASDETTRLFRDQYADKLVIRDTRFMEPDKNRRNMAMAWYQLSAFRGKRLQVSSAFHGLGIKSICELCQDHDGFTAEREPDCLENARIRLLQHGAEQMYQGLLVLDHDHWPKCRILVNPKAPVCGYTKVRKKTGGRNLFGMQVRAHADYVYLEVWLLRADRFPQAFTTYSHELLHQFGGDSSTQFHKALRLMNERIMQNLPLLQAMQKDWCNVG